MLVFPKTREGLQLFQGKAFLRNPSALIINLLASSHVGECTNREDVSDDSAAGCSAWGESIPESTDVIPAQAMKENPQQLLAAHWPE